MIFFYAYNVQKYCLFQVHRLSYLSCQVSSQRAIIQAKCRFASIFIRIYLFNFYIQWEICIFNIHFNHNALIRVYYKILHCEGFYTLKPINHLLICFYFTLMEIHRQNEFNNAYLQINCTTNVIFVFIYSLWADRHELVIYQHFVYLSQKRVKHCMFT